MSIDLSKYAGHTPGPWAIEPDWDARRGGSVAVVNREVDGADWDVCEVHSTEANARLIADAPVLLAALAAEQSRAERLAEALRVIAEYQPQLSNTWNQDIDAIRHLARAALPGASTGPTTLEESPQ